MKQLKVYRKIHERNKILGLEYPDLLLLVFVYLGVFLFSKNLFLNLLVIGTAYFFFTPVQEGETPALDLKRPPFHFQKPLLRPKTGTPQGAGT